MASETLPDAAPPRGRLLRRLLWVLVALVALVLVYYVGGAAYFHRIDDDPAFGRSVEVPEGGSRAVAVAAALVEREVETYRWVANDPFFQPAWILDNMPSFQTGIVYGVSRFAVELTDHLARVRGASQVDPDADGAAGRLKYPGDIWFLEWSRTPVQPSSESQYRRAVEDLRRFNDRLARGQAVFERRADNLIATLERIAADTGGSSAASFEQIDSGATVWLDFHADNLFYANKGRIYAYALLLEALGQDFAAVIGERNVQRNWDELVRTFMAAAVVQPWVVSNGALDSMWRPNHLAAQGFLLLRARFQLYEVINVLTK